MQASATTQIKFLFSLQTAQKNNFSLLKKKRLRNKLLTLSFKKHMLKILSFLTFFLLLSIAIQAQELQGKVTVLSQQVGSNIDKSVFTNLQTQLTNFVTNRKWTSDVFQPQEKIRCNFLLTIQSVDENNVYKATLSVQAARPVYNSSYQT